MGMGARFEERVNLAIEREAKRVWEQRLRASQADIAACEAELKQRKELIAGLEKTLARRKAVATARAADFKKPRPR